MLLPHKKSQPCSLNRHSDDLQKLVQFRDTNSQERPVHRRLRVVKEDLKKVKMVVPILPMLVMVLQMIQNLSSLCVLIVLEIRSMQSFLLRKHLKI